MDSHLYSSADAAGVGLHWKSGRSWDMQGGCSCCSGHLPERCGRLLLSKSCLREFRMEPGEPAGVGTQVSWTHALPRASRRTFDGFQYWWCQIHGRWIGFTIYGTSGISVCWRSARDLKTEESFFLLKVWQSIGGLHGLGTPQEQAYAGFHLCSFEDEFLSGLQEMF